MKPEETFEAFQRRIHCNHTSFEDLERDVFEDRCEIRKLKDKNDILEEQNGALRSYIHCDICDCGDIFEGIECTKLRNRIEADAIKDPNDKKV